MWHSGIAPSQASLPPCASCAPQDSVILADTPFLALLEALAPRCRSVKHIVLLTGAHAWRGAEALLEGLGCTAPHSRGSNSWPTLPPTLRLPSLPLPAAADERHMPKQASLRDPLCYEELLQDEAR